jgi:hypothetical protein
VLAGLLLVFLITGLLLVTPGVLGVLGAVLLLLAVLPFYAPTRYALDGEGVAWRGVVTGQRRPWESLGYFFVDGDQGVWVSSQGTWGLLARTRGIYLPFGDCREAIMAWVESRLQRVPAEDSDADKRS